VRGWVRNPQSTDKTLKNTNMKDPKVGENVCRVFPSAQSLFLGSPYCYGYQH
jgi:hypothetical protein